MNKEFSFYEFTGLITPSVILLFSIDILLKKVCSISIFDFSNLGESLVFIVIAYGFGHIIQSFGYFFEKFIWWLLKGRPTQWLKSDGRFKQTIVSQTEAQKILSKLQSEFGDKRDYGSITYTKVYGSDKSGRIDIFNGNFSLFRGLSICFIALLITTICLHLGWWFLVPLSFLVVSTVRMIHFGKCYARELYRTYFML